MSDIEIPDSALTDNTEQRLPCVLVLDGSGSMAGAPIEELNAGLRLLEEELKADDVASQRVRLLVIRFGDDNNVEVLSDWTDAMDFRAPKITANGRTPLGEAVRVALTKIEEEKTRYRALGIAYNRPWLFLLTDGEPTDDDWGQAAAQCRAAEQADRVVFFGIGVGEAKLETLERFSNRKPKRLQGLKFRELFVWLSRSSKTASRTAQGGTVQMASPDDWAEAPT